MIAILEFDKWDEKYNKKPVKVDEGLLSRFFGSNTSDLARLCEEIRHMVDQIPSTEQQDVVLAQLEAKFGSSLINALDNGWTSEDFEKHKDSPAVHELQKKAGDIRNWIDQTIG